MAEQTTTLFPFSVIGLGYQDHCSTTMESLIDNNSILHVALLWTHYRKTYLSEESSNAGKDGRNARR